MIDFPSNEVERLLGTAVPREQVCSILHSLEFVVEELSEELLRVTVPSHRGDVELPADLVEEVVRIWGLDNLPSTLPADRTGTGGQSERLTVSSRIREVLVGAGLQEALNYTFGRPDQSQRLRRGTVPQIKLQNPISEGLSALRISLLPGLLEAVSLNASRQQARTALFELGAVYLGELPLVKQPKEELRLGLVLWGSRHAVNWALPSEEYDFYDLKGLVELLLPWPELEWRRGQDPAFHPGRQVSLCWQGQEIGVCGEVHPRCCAATRSRAGSMPPRSALSRYCLCVDGCPDSGLYRGFLLSTVTWAWWSTQGSPLARCWPLCGSPGSSFRKWRCSTSTQASPSLKGRRVRPFPSASRESAL